MSTQVIDPIKAKAEELLGVNEPVKVASVVYYVKEFRRHLKKNPGKTFNDYSKIVPGISAQSMIQKIKDVIIKVHEAVPEDAKPLIRTVGRANNSAATTPSAVRQISSSFVKNAPAPSPGFLAGLMGMVNPQAIVPNPQAIVPRQQAAIVRNPISNMGVGIVGFCPLVNVGNSCYMNSAMQLLYSIPELHQFFTTVSLQDITNSDLAGGPLPNPQNLVVRQGNSAEVIVRKECLNAGYTSDNMKKLLKIMRLFYTNMNAIAQGQSRKSALRIDELEYEAGGNDIYSELISMLHLGKYAQEDVADFIRPVLARFICSTLVGPIASLFKFNMRKQFFCVDKSVGNQGVVTRIESSFEISLHIKDPDIISVQAAIEKFQEKEVAAEGENRLDICVPPGGKRPLNNEAPNVLHLQMRCEVLPDTKYICIGLKRRLIALEKDRYGKFREIREKLTKKVSVNPQINIGGVLFRPKIAAIHSGGFNGGHYYAYSFKADGSPDIKFNDDRISQASSSDMNDINSNAVFIIYEKIAAVAPVAAVVQQAVVQQLNEESNNNENSENYNAGSAIEEGIRQNEQQMNNNNNSENYNAENAIEEAIIQNEQTNKGELSPRTIAAMFAAMNSGAPPQNFNNNNNNSVELVPKKNGLYDGGNDLYSGGRRKRKTRKNKKVSKKRITRRR